MLMQAMAPCRNVKHFIGSKAMVMKIHIKTRIRMQHIHPHQEASAFASNPSWSTSILSATLLRARTPWAPIGLYLITKLLTVPLLRKASAKATAPRERILLKSKRSSSKTSLDSKAVAKAVAPRLPMALNRSYTSRSVGRCARAFATTPAPASPRPQSISHSVRSHGAAARTCTASGLSWTELIITVCSVWRVPKAVAKASCWEFAT